MKLLLKDNFKIEIPDLDMEIEGKLKRLTKQQKKELDKGFKKYTQKADRLSEITNRAKRIEFELKNTEDDYDLKKELFDLEDEANDIRKQLTGDDLGEDAAKKRFDMSIESGDMDKLIEVCEMVGYAKVMETINEDIQDRLGNGKKSS